MGGGRGMGRGGKLDMLPLSIYVLFMNITIINFICNRYQSI